MSRSGATWARSAPGSGQYRRMTRYEIDATASTVDIVGSSSIHPITARATGLVGWIETDTPEAGSLRAEVRISVDRLGSGNPLVDLETRRRIDARRFPEIVGIVTAAAPLADGRIAVTGDLTFRGERRSVTGEIDLEIDDQGVVVRGDQTFDVREWGLRLPRLGLLRVHPDVQVRIEVHAQPAS